MAGIFEILKLESRKSESDKNLGSQGIFCNKLKVTWPQRYKYDLISETVRESETDGNLGSHAFSIITIFFFKFQKFKSIKLHLSQKQLAILRTGRELEIIGILNDHSPTFL